MNTRSKANSKKSLTLLPVHNEAEEAAYFQQATKKQKEAFIYRKKLVLREYIKNLYNYLGERYCFTSGGFIIGDTNNVLSNLLKFCKDVRLRFMGSHKSLLNQSVEVQEVAAEEEIEVFSVRNYVYETYMPGDLSYMMSCNCLNGEHDTSRPVTNVKWYQFIGKDHKLYIFLKLEDFPTKTWNHFTQGFSTYVLGKLNESCREARRENCVPCTEDFIPIKRLESVKSLKKVEQLKSLHTTKSTQSLKKLRSKNCCSIDRKLNNDYQYKRFQIENGYVQDVLETYGRTGDEIFVPFEISEYILLHIVNNIVMTYGDDSVHINVPKSTVVGGKRRPRKPTRITRRTIRTRTTRRLLRRTRR